MRLFLLAALAISNTFAYDSAGDSAGDSMELTRARQQLETVRQQASDGLVPAAAVAEAQETVADAADQQVLDGSLYGKLRLEDLTADQAGAMVGAAERRLDRTHAKLDEMRRLIDAGVAERARSADLEADFAARSQALEQAQARAGLVLEIVATANAEATPADGILEWNAKEHFEGDDHPLEDEDIRAITLAFEKQFREPLPVSARGETAVHRALGFDHTGRVDVALTPDSAEGQWLRKYLEQRSIPYYAFRVAIPGKATAPHIHIGPASTRLHLAD
jgi:hypothetical protein